MLLQKIKNLIWWFKYRTTEKYHIVKTGLKPGYYDTDHVMLHACFNLLKGFVEVEISHMYLVLSFKGKVPRWKWQYKKFIKEHQREFIIKYLDYWLDEKHWKDASEEEMQKYIQRDQEIKELYLWWVDERPARLARLEKEWSNPHHTSKQLVELDQAGTKEDEEMLIRLMKIRSALWT